MLGVLLLLLLRAVCGCVVVQVSKLQYHQSLVRDCSWHPYEPELTTVSWDGTIISWGVEAPSKPLRRHRE